MLTEIQRKQQLYKTAIINAKFVRAIHFGYLGSTQNLSIGFEDGEVVGVKLSYWRPENGRAVFRIWRDNKEALVDETQLRSFVL